MRLPMTARRVIAKPRAPETATIAPEQVGGDAAFVQEDVLPHVAQREPGAPATALRGDVRPSLFVGVYGFF